MGDTVRLIMEDERNIAIPEINIVNAEPWHVSELRNNLRTEDANEILRFGVSIERALWCSYKRAVIRKTAFIDGKIAAMWGVGGTFMGRTGVPWLMTTPEVKNISPLRFARIYQEETKNMRKMFLRLENYVDLEYNSAIRLLDIIGFTVDKPQRVGTGMYCRFWMGK